MQLVMVYSVGRVSGVLVRIFIPGLATQALQTLDAIRRWWDKILPLSLAFMASLRCALM